MSFTSLEGEFLLVHSLSIKLREGVGGAAEGGVHGAIDFIEARGDGLPLLRHGN